MFPVPHPLKASTLLTSPLLPSGLPASPRPSLVSMCVCVCVCVCVHVYTNTHPRTHARAHTHNKRARTGERHKERARERKTCMYYACTQGVRITSVRTQTLSPKLNKHHHAHTRGACSLDLSTVRNLDRYKSSYAHEDGSGDREKDAKTVAGLAVSILMCVCVYVCVCVCVCTCVFVVSLSLSVCLHVTLVTACLCVCVPRFPRSGEKSLPDVLPASSPPTPLPLPLSRTLAS
jgi:Flp pilus assembly protein TadB